MEWSDFYPPNCPPAEVEPASGTVYRLVLHDPVQADDFKSPFEEKPRQFKNRSNREKCKSCGLSVHTNPQDSEQLKNRIGRLRHAQIAEGELNAALGVMNHTPSRQEQSHVSWWVPIGAEPWTVFNVNGNSSEKENDH